MSRPARARHWCRVIVELEIKALAGESVQDSPSRLDPERVAWYVEHLDEAAPVTVFQLEDRLLLADGHHRVEAAQRLGRTRVLADVRRGSPQDALRFAARMAAEQRGLTEDEAVEAIKRRAGRRWGQS